MNRDDLVPIDEEPSSPTAAGFVVAILDGEVVVNLDGVLRRAGAQLVPKLRVGDWVRVGPEPSLGGARVDGLDDGVAQRRPGLQRPRPVVAVGEDDHGDVDGRVDPEECA